MQNQIFESAIIGNISKFREAITRGADINSINENGQTSLIIACKNGQLQLAKFIISKGASLNIIDKEGNDALFYANQLNMLELISLLSYTNKNSESIKNTVKIDLYNQLTDNVSFVFNQIEKRIYELTDEDIHAIKNDIKNILQLFRKSEQDSLLYSFGYYLSQAMFLDTKNFKNTCNIIKALSIEEKELYAKELLNEEKEKLIDKNISFESFSFNKIISKNEYIIRKSIYELYEIITKSDGLVTIEEINVLKFLSSKIFNNSIEEKTTSNSTINVNVNLSAALEELNNLVGLDNIKNEIQSLINILKINNLRKLEGLPEQIINLHSVFYGPPGTGKTTVARILANIYYSLGIISTNKLVETDRSDLVAGYIGQTAIKTTAIIEEALNGVLFIDEAYTLKRSDSNSDYGQEAIDILLKSMEDKRSDFIVIAAGYEYEMKKFIDSNPGLKSRFNRYFEFKDYAVSELIEIYMRISKKSGFIVIESAEQRLNSLFSYLVNNKNNQFGNARLVRNIFEKAFEKHANRTASLVPITREILTTILEEDIPFDEFINRN